MSNLLFALLPALGWGLLPILTSKIGGRPANQILGTTAGAFVVGLIVYLVKMPNISPMVFLLGILSGACWVIGQVGQYNAYQKLGVSTTMPISTGLQIIGTSLIGVFAFGEWNGPYRIFGFIALIIILIGVYLTSLTDNVGSNKKTDKTALILLIVTTIGYIGYSTIPKAASSIVGSGSDSSVSIFFPQTLGMILGAIIYLLLSGQSKAFKDVVSWKNTIVGLIFGATALAYIYSLVMNGVATAFVISQLSVVISTIGGIVFLHEHKTKKEYIFTIIGLILIVIGALLTAIQ